MTQSIYIVGSKGIPAKYGGFETFVEKLTEFQQDKNIQYYVACMRENSEKSEITADTFEHNGAICYNIDVPNIGPARAIAYDIAALNKAIEIAKENKDQAPIFYVLACRIGPFISGIKKKVKAIGGTLMVNPDGHESVSYTHLDVYKRQNWRYLCHKGDGVVVQNISGGNCESLIPYCLFFCL